MTTSRRCIGWLAMGCLLALCQFNGNSCCAAESSSDSDFQWYDAGNWTTLDGRPVDESWEFTDAEIRLANPRGGRGSIVTPPMPANFELTWKWKIDARTNTGLKYRVRRFGKHMFSGNYLGIEYQIIDDSATNVSKGSTASIYDLVAPQTEKILHPIGEWNEAKIVAKGNYLAHFLNGRLVTETTLSGPQWDHAIAMSKFFGATDFGRPAEGDRIMLTDHGGKAAYKDFQLVTLVAPQTPDEVSSGAGPFLGNAMRNSWADQTSIVLWTRTTRNAEMLADGKRFVSIAKNETARLAASTDAAEIIQAQLPENATLDEMLGACPGAPGRVRLTYFPEKQRKNVKSTDWTTTSADNDFATQWKLENLKPDTRYAAVIEATSLDNDTPTAVIRGAFRTAPPKGKKADLTFCFTTCHDFIRRDDDMRGHKIYPVMSEMAPDFVVHAGDIEYYDKPDPWAMTKELMRFKWGRIFSLPSNREFYKNTSSYFLKDDHDTLKNDCWAGQRYGTVTFEEGVKIFNEEQFPSHPTRYKTIHWGKDLQIWLLEGRDYRSPNNLPDGPDKTILGAKQKAWLFETLEASTAKFKVICSPTPIVGPDRQNKRDNHANDVFDHEGDEIREQLAKLDGVIVLCGDRHWQYASVDETTGLWEFGCGPGSEKHGLGWKPGDQRPVHRFLRVKGGFLSGTLKYRGDDQHPELTLRHHKVTGEPVSEFQFPVESDDESN